MASIRPCLDTERARILEIVNAAAEAYRGVIPDDCWHEPYMPEAELEGELDAGVVFSGLEDEGELVAVMGIQAVGAVDLIRHAYTSPSRQGHGFGSALLDHLTERGHAPDARGHVGRRRVGDPVLRAARVRAGLAQRKTKLLKTYWTIPERQIETSVVLAGQGAE